MGVANLARYKKWKYHAVTHIKLEYPFLHTTNSSGTTHDFADGPHRHGRIQKMGTAFSNRLTPNLRTSTGAE